MLILFLLLLGTPADSAVVEQLPLSYLEFGESQDVQVSKLHHQFLRSDSKQDSQADEEYRYSIDYSKRDWEGVLSPSGGEEIPLMEVLKTRIPNQIRLAYTGTQA